MVSLSFNSLTYDIPCISHHTHNTCFPVAILFCSACWWLAGVDPRSLTYWVVAMIQFLSPVITFHNIFFRSNLRNNVVLIPTLDQYYTLLKYSKPTYRSSGSSPRPVDALPLSVDWATFKRFAICTANCVTTSCNSDFCSSSMNSCRLPARGFFQTYITFLKPGEPFKHIHSPITVSPYVWHIKPYDSLAIFSK